MKNIKFFTLSVIMFVFVFLVVGCTNTTITSENTNTDVESTDTAVQKTPEENRDDQRREDLMNVEQAIKDRFFDELDEVVGEDSDEVSYPLVNSYNELKSLLVPKYLEALPREPSNKKYYYVASDDGYGFALGAWSEMYEDISFKRIRQSTPELEAKLLDVMRNNPF